MATKKRFAVLLLRVNGANPAEPFDRQHAERLFTAAGAGTNNLVDYYRDMSHDRIDLGDSEVIGWLDYGHSAEDLVDEWKEAKKTKKAELLKAGQAEAAAEAAANLHANAHRRHMTVEWGRQAAAATRSLDGFDGVICVFNTPIDYFGSSAGHAVVNWDPSANHTVFSVDLTGICHEVGHMLGLNHSYFESSPAEYMDPYDIMSAYSVVYDTTGTNTPPGSPYFTFGPGLNAVNMDYLGWLDATRVLTGGAQSFTLRPLHRRDLPGWLAAKLTIGYETIYVEFRSNERWDRAMSPCVLLHRRRTEGPAGTQVSELLADTSGPSPTPLLLTAGKQYEAGDKADPFGFYAQLRVTRIDRVALEADVTLQVRQHRRVEPSGILFGGVRSGGGGLMWTPGRGLVKVPPRSPLLPVLEMLADFEAVQENQALMSRQGSPALLSASILREAGERLTSLARAQVEDHVPGPPLEGRGERRG